MLRFLRMLFLVAICTHFATGELDLESDASSLFRNSHSMQCRSLRWDPLSRATYFTSVRSKHENSTSRFPQAAAALNQDIDSLAVVISLVVDEHRLPASRSYVNVLLSRQTPNIPSQQFLLSQNFKVTSPYLKVTGGAADALSVKTLQLNMLLPMTGMTYSLAAQTSKWETALLPAGEYAVEVQLIETLAQASDRRAYTANWRKLSSIGSTDELDEAAVDHGAKVTGCVRLGQTFSLPWIEVDSKVTDTLPLMLHEGGSKFEVSTSRSGDVDEPFATSSLLYVRSSTAFPRSDNNNASHGHEERMTLTVLSMTGRTSATCSLKMMAKMTVPLMVTHQFLAYFVAPAMPVSCGRVNYLAEYIYPDHRHRVMFDFHTATVEEDTVEANQLSQLVAQQPGFSEQLVLGMRRVLETSQSQFVQYEPVGVDWVRNTVESMIHATSFESFRGLWKDRLSKKDVDQALALALLDAQKAMQQVVYDTPVASSTSNSSSYMVEEVFPVIDGFTWNLAWANRSHEQYMAWLSGLSAQPAPEMNIPNVPYEDMDPKSDDFFGPTVTAKDTFQVANSVTAMPAESRRRRRRQLALSSEYSHASSKAQVCNMEVVANVLQDLNSALAKLARNVAYVKGFIAQLQLLRQRDFTVTLLELLREMVADRTRLTDDMMVALVQLYTHTVVLSVMIKNVHHISSRLLTMTDCLVPCRTTQTVEMRTTKASCDSFFDVPLTYDLEVLNVHRESCVVGWFPEEINRLNAWLSDMSMPVSCLRRWLPRDVYTSIGWDETMDDLFSMRKRPLARSTYPVQNGQLLSVTSNTTMPFACDAVSSDDGQRLSFQCSCSPLYSTDEVNPLTFRVEYVASLQWLASATTVVQIPMSRTAAMIRPLRIHIDDGKVSNNIGGTYKRFSSPDMEDAYLRNDLQYIVFFRQGHANCPKGEWIVVPASSSWKKYVDPSVEVPDDTTKVVATFDECTFLSEADKAGFTMKQSYDEQLLNMRSGYNLSFFYY